MYYFVPSWYGNQRRWYTDVMPWHSISDKIEFDDTINQIRVFQETETPAKLVILQYFPQLRYFLHRQDLFETPYSSIFDDIQQIPKDFTVKMISLEDFEWSEQVEFVYTPFLIMIYENGMQTGIVDHGPDGNIISIKRMEFNQITSEYILDDRGFISSIIYYEDNVPHHQEYLTIDGEWVIREQLVGENTVQVNPKFQGYFKKERYLSIDALIFEKYRLIEENFVEDDILVIASSHVHNNFLLTNRKYHFKTVFSFFLDRLPIENNMETRVWSYAADLIITDTNSNKQKLLEIDPIFNLKTHRISSFDTRLQLGSSQQRKESKIYFYLKSHEDINQDAIKSMLEVVSQDELIYIVFALYNVDGFQLAQVENTIEELINSNFNLEDFEVKEDEEVKADGLIEESIIEIPPVYRYSIKNFNNEIGVIKELEFTRLIVDLAEEPDLYTQIAGISAGIPQINKVESEYVEHLKNGYIISDFTELNNATDYYLKTLKPWNESLIYSIEKIKENTGFRMIQKWEEWLGKR